MYCATCREERLSDSTGCAVCGGAMTRRPREAMLEELAHLQFLLADIHRWSSDDVPEPVQGWVRNRYRTRAEVLLRTLNVGAAPEVPQVAVPAPVPVPVTPGAPPPSPREFLDRQRAVDEVGEALAAVVADARLVAEPVPRVKASPESMPAPAPEARVREAAPVTPPKRAPARAKAPPAPSRWLSVWRPFLYESIGWFVGGFLILAGAFYFVADGWASALTRSLVVFGVCALYALGFMLWSAFLRRRAALEAAGRVVGIIGAALAPFPVLALGPVSEASAALGGGLTWTWSVVAAVLVRNLATALDRKARTPLAVATVTSTLALGFGPLLAGFGPAVAWLPLVPLACLALVAIVPNEQSDAGSVPPAPRALAFSLLAPLYLATAMAIRLGLALHAADLAPRPGTWAALVSIAVAAALRALPRERPRAVSALEIAAVSVQAAALAGAVFGDAPAFFLCSAAVAWTGLYLSRLPSAKSPELRVRWLYVTFFAGLLAWHSSGQLVPGYVKTLAEQVKLMLGHAPGAPFPFNFGAVFSLPYFLGALFLALRWTDLEDARRRAVGELLLRASTALGGLIAVLAFCGTDLRAGLWSVPLVSAVLLAAGFWTDRRWATWAAAVLALLVPLYALEALGTAGSAWSACAVAIVLSASSLLHRATERSVLGLCALLASVMALAAAVFAHGEGFAPSLLSAVAAAVAGGAALLAGRNHGRTSLWSPALAVVVGALTLVSWRALPGTGPLALAALSVVVAALALRGRGSARDWLAALPVAAVGAFVASACCIPEFSPVSDAVLLPGGVFLFSALALGLCGLRAWPLHLPSAVLGVTALLPANDVFALWPSLSPSSSVALLALVAAATAVWTVRAGRSVLTASWAACALVALSLSAGIAESSLLALVAAGVGLLTLRALIPAVTVPWAAAMALFAAIEAKYPGVVGLTCALTVLALLDESPSLRRHLFGGWRAGLTASICALLVATGTILAAALATEPPPALLLVPLIVSSLLWARATRAWAFLLFPLPLLAGVLAAYDEPGAWLLSLPLLLVACTRALDRWELGPQRRAGQWALAGSGAMALAALLVTGAPPQLAIAASLALVLASSGLVGPRLIVASVFALWMPQLSWAFALGFLALGFAADHLPALAARIAGLARGDESEVLDPRWPASAAVAGAVVAFSAAPGEATAMTIAFALFGATLLFGARWMLTSAVVAAAIAPLLQFGGPGAGTGGHSLRLALFAAAASLLSLSMTLRAPREAVAGILRRLAPWESPSVRHPLWAAGAFLVGLGLVVSLVESTSAFGRESVLLSPAVAALLVVASLALVWSRQTALAVGGSALLVLSAMSSGPMAWAPAVGAGTAMLLGVFGSRVVPAEAREALRHFGWAAALPALFLLDSLGHASTPVAAAFATVAVWNATRGTRFEPLGWLAAWAALHVGLLFAGIHLSTGRGKPYILPYLGAASVLLSFAATLWASLGTRRPVVLALAFVGALEVCSAGVLIEGVATREAFVGGAALLFGCVLLMRQALRHNDELSAWAAQALLIAAYVTGRHLGSAVQFGAGDSLVALVAGGVASGLNGRLWKLSERWAALGRPLWGTGIVLPLIGLLATPWESSGTGAALLLAHAAHFSLLARHRPLRRLGALLAFAAFNGALVFGWLETRVVEPQYFLIPSALAALLLVKVFESDLSLVAAARLRAVAATVIHAAAAFRPLVFDSTWAMLGCVAVCVVGIAAGVVTRVRSFVYLGTGFLVTTVLANLIRHGVRDPRLGALFLSALGLLIIVFMVVLSARRAELVERYDKLRHTLDTWQG